MPGSRPAGLWSPAAAWRSTDVLARTFLLLLIAGDLLFIGIHLLDLKMMALVAEWIPYDDRVKMRVDTDRGYAESYQYVKFLWSALLVSVASARGRRWSLLPWAAMFLAFMIDDAIQLHERIGWDLAERYGFRPALGLRPEDFGELAVVAASGAALLVPIAVGYALGGPDARRAGRTFLALLALLAGFGVVGDMVHVVAMDNPRLDRYLALIEDGGEMLAASLICGYAFPLVSGTRPGVPRGGP